MEDSANKALTIGTAIMITIIITSGVLYSIGQMQNVYSTVYETGQVIQTKFDEFDAFENTEKTGIQVVNAIHKYMDNALVKIVIEGVASESPLNRTNPSLDLKAVVAGSSGKPYGEVLFTSTMVKKDDFVNIRFKRK